MKKDLVTTNMIGQEDLAEAWSEINDKIADHKKKIKILEKMKEPYEKAMKDGLEDADIGIAKGWQILWKRGETHRFNTDRFKEDHPDLFEEYYETKPSRRFQVVQTALPEKKEEEEFNF